MSEGFSNPIIGGDGALVYPSIHSPNFAQGPPITGWSIDKNGNAFFSGTVGGLAYEINSAGAFFYQGTPAAGNLVASIASQGGTDRFGNTYVQGQTAYFSSTVYANLLSGNLNLANGADTWILSVDTANDSLLMSENASGQGLYLAKGATGSPGIMPNDPNSVTSPETLHSIASGFPAGWSGTVHYARLAETQLVFVSWRLSIAAGTVVAAGLSGILAANKIPAGYQPVNFHNAAGINFDRTAGFGPAAVISVGNDGSFNYSGPGFTAGATGNQFEGSMVYSTAI